MNNTVGIFYELPDGRIAKTNGFNEPNKTISFYFDDDNGCHTINIDEWQTWKPREDLKDFPNARDPRVPYVFDLHWDLKYISQVRKVLAGTWWDEIQDIDFFLEVVAEHFPEELENSKIITNKI